MKKPLEDMNIYVPVQCQAEGNCIEDELQHVLAPKVRLKMQAMNSIHAVPTVLQQDPGACYFLFLMTLHAYRSITH